tara:strand:+ start:10803 stop:12119 length:1317 start_codon:yes stop_codon:yes gene_type:complete
MKFKISNKPFYQNHNLELERYQKFENTLHIVNKKSFTKINDNESDIVPIDFNTDMLSPIEEISKKYDVILLTDIIEDSYDIYEFLKIVKVKLNPSGKLIISSVNTRWRFFTKFFELIKLKDSTSKDSYIHQDKIKNVANGIGLEYIYSTSRQFFPFKLFGIGTLLNILFELIFFKFKFGIKTYTIFRNVSKERENYTKTIIIPAKNEEGNLPTLFSRIPNKENYEIVFSIGTSLDNTEFVAKKIKEENKDIDIKVINQTKTGKANAVWEAIDVSNGELIAILDADISVDPETMPYFFEIIELNNADFVNGTRLIYEMEKGSMRFINKLGNRAFQLIVGILTNVDLTDSLCGTKVFKRKLVNKIFWWQNSFSMNDPFGDFDLLFSAAFTGDKIIEYPIHYRTRTYGKTQISRFKDGFKLIVYLIKSFLVFNTSRRFKKI